tara:strand:+ start:9382 stop:9612 length:231 start_codon:yes stop_codon:yes gene_type:complete
MPKAFFLLPLTSAVMVLTSCSTHHEITHRVEPVHITVEVNVQVEEQLNNFFDELDTASETIIVEDEVISTNENPNS